MTEKRVVEGLDEITPSWLTRVLSEDGALRDGEVKSIQIQGLQERELSTSAQLRLTYLPTSTGQLPTKLFLKMVKTAYDEDDPLLATEVDYYARDYVGVQGAPIPRCYGAERTADGSRYHLLLEDLSGSHVVAHKKTLSLEHGEAFADAVATLHARWWGASRLLDGGHPIHGAEAIEQFVDISRPGSEHILDAFHHELEPHWPYLIREIYERHPALLVERTIDGGGFTLIHGDLSAGNILVPAVGVRPLYLIDRAPFEWSLTTWLGVYDLSYAMVTYWDFEDRRALEEPILNRYHARLLELGIEGYSLDKVREDYRLCAPMSVYVASEWCRGGMNLDTKRYWMPMLRGALTACDDLGSADLWREN